MTDTLLGISDTGFNELSKQMSTENVREGERPGSFGAGMSAALPGCGAAEGCASAEKADLLVELSPTPHKMPHISTYTSPLVQQPMAFQEMMMGTDALEFCQACRLETNLQIHPVMRIVLVNDSII